MGKKEKVPKPLIYTQVDDLSQSKRQMMFCLHRTFTGNLLSVEGKD